ncbi:MAG: hypothetical protein QOE54_3303, partial [Streptosporangiaceae bacterium]|nr:hypothetical protein [Streptosporangiaceae bacterium]
MNRFTKLIGAAGVSLLLAGSLAGCGGSSGGGAGGAALDITKTNLPKTAADISGTIDKSKVKKSLVVGVDNPYYL